jgi:hypothetical protein
VPENSGLEDAKRVYESLLAKTHSRDRALKLTGMYMLLTQGWAPSEDGGKLQCTYQFTHEQAYDTCLFLAG